MPFVTRNRGSYIAFALFKYAGFIVKIQNQFSSVAQLCPTLYDPLDCSTPSFPVHHQLPELAQTHVHQVGVAIQPSHPLSSPSPPAFNLAQHQGLRQWVSSSHQVASVYTCFKKMKGLDVYERVTWGKKITGILAADQPGMSRMNKSGPLPWYRRQASWKVKGSKEIRHVWEGVVCLEQQGKQIGNL